MNILKLQKAQCFLKQVSLLCGFFSVFADVPWLFSYTYLFPQFKLVFCAWMSQILVSNRYNIQSNHPTWSHSCCSRRLHLQGEPPTFSLFQLHYLLPSFHLILPLPSFAPCICFSCLFCFHFSHLSLPHMWKQFLGGSGLSWLFISPCQWFDNEAYGPVSCLHNHCLDLGFACEISLKVHSKTCLLRVFSALHDLSHLALHLFLSCI